MLKWMRQTAAALVIVAVASSVLAQSTPHAAAAPITTAQQSEPIDINTASAAELKALPGIGDVYSAKIIKGRPYQRKDQLVSRKIIPPSTYNKIRNLVTAKQPKS